VKRLYDEYDDGAKLNRCVGKCFLESGGFNYLSTITDAKYGSMQDVDTLVACATKSYQKLSMYRE
jgi:hypothetical protein